MFEATEESEILLGFFLFSSICSLMGNYIRKLYLPKGETFSIITRSTLSFIGRERSFILELSQLGHIDDNTLLAFSL